MRSRLLVVAMLILYGSLYPWHFEARHLAVNPVMYVLHRWDAAANSYLVHDVVVNIALYLPLGLAAGYIFEAPFGPIMLGLVLSSLVEFLQIYVPGRQPSTVDILANTAGTATGYVVSVLLRAIPDQWLPDRVAKWIPWAFLSALLAIRLVPLHFVPTPRDFEWVPFGLLLQGNAQAGLMVLTAKAVCYTGTIWLFRLSGWRNLPAAALVTGVVALMETIRTYAPATSPGITDPVIAALGGLLVASLYPETGRRSRSAG
jgi:VanZ family protein